MNNTTPLFPRFHLQTLRRKPRSSQQKLADEMIVLKQKSFSQLGECFGRFIPFEYLRPTEGIRGQSKNLDSLGKRVSPEKGQPGMALT